MKYDPVYLREFYDRYGEKEWERLGKTAYGRLQFIIQWHFVMKYVSKEAKVLDAGGGPGRFAIELARSGAKVVLLDISPVQLAIAKEKLREAGEEIARRVELVEGDVCDLPFEDETFDLALALGGPLSYVLEKAGEALQELRQVTRRGGHLIFTVMSNYGGARWAVKLKALQYFQDPEGYDLWGLVERGLQADHVPSERRSCHRCNFYTSKELQELLTSSGLEVLEMAAIPSVSAHLEESLEAFAVDPVAWENLVQLEIQLCRNIV